jgi:subtilisin-like proprotein convertase family protein
MIAKRWNDLRGMAALVLAVALFAWPTPQAFAVPATVAVEGFLNSTGGGAAPDGDYAVGVGLYAAELGGQAVWSEGPLTVTAKGGHFSFALGTQKPLNPATLADASSLWLGVTIGSDPELPRKPLHAVPFAVRAGVASGLACSGCVTAGHLDPQVLAPYAKAADLSKVSKSGAYADLSGAPTLAAVAKTGAYADLEGKPTFAAIATTGAYGDLDGLPVLAKVGAACGTGLVMRGILADGAYDCVSGTVDASKLPGDGLNEISAGSLTNEFADVFASAKTPVAIPDNSPVGISDVIEIPDLGVTQGLTITAEVSNSDMSSVKITLIDPNADKFVLWDKSAKGTVVKTSWPAPTKTLSGDLATWVGKNPKGKWYLEVIDTGFVNNTLDGAIQSWSITSKTVSSKKVQVKGDLVVDKSVTADTLAASALTATTVTGTTLNGTTVNATEVKATKVTATAVTADTVTANTKLVSGGGRVQRDLLQWSTTANSPTKIQIKTNIKIQTNTMYRLLVEGYNYGASAVINSDAVGYTYSGWSCLGSTSVNNYAGGGALSQYCSADGYVVLRLTVPSAYFMGFSVSAWTVNPAGQGFSVEAKVYHQDADL